MWSTAYYAAIFAFILFLGFVGGAFVAMTAPWNQLETASRSGNVPEGVLSKPAAFVERRNSAKPMQAAQ